ncbi:sushi, von Willebrand factor type A, EGF and pentraxin domain-containing protein 1-like [Glandiceps talaboti]
MWFLQIQNSSTLEIFPGNAACDCDSKSTCACGTRSGEYMCACNPGQIIVTSGCEACPLHAYSEVYDAVECTACPDKSETADTGSTSRDQCECIAGYVIVDSECLADCGTPPTGTQISKICSQSPYVNGDSCTYMCTPGYHTTDGLSTVDITCSDGTWSASSVICIADCSAPMLTQATGSCKSPYLHDKTCTYSCNTGYHTSDGLSTVDITCNGGTWSDDSVICVADCSTPMLTQATGSCASPYLHDKTCTYSCNTGYHTSDGLSTVDITCNAGTWSDSSVVCIADCSTPKLTQATGSCASPYFHDKTCTYTCNTGYHTSDGSSTVDITCNDGTWSASSAITCIDDEPPIIDCPSDYSTTSNIIPVQVTWEEPVYNDIVDGINVDVTQTHTSGSSFYIGTTTVEYNVEDQSGNSASCSFTITIVDYMCSPKTIPENGAVACTTWDIGIGCGTNNLSGSQICVLLCDKEFDFESQPASLYLCQYKKKLDEWVWTFEPCHGSNVIPENGYETSPNCIEPFDINDVQGHIDFQYFVEECTTEGGSQEIRDIFIDFMKNITNTIETATHCSDETICNAEAVDYFCGATTAKRSLDTVLRFTISLEVERLHNQIVSGELDPVDVIDEVVSFYITEVDAFIRDIDGIIILGAETPEVDIDVDCRRRSTLENDKCLICGQGSYYDKTTGGCQECAKGYFQHEEASTSCRQCPTGTTTDSSGSNSISHCKAESSGCPMPHHPVDGIFTCTPPPNPPVCHVQCQEGFDFAREPADIYVCDYSSGWRTEPVGMDELLPNCGETILVQMVTKKLQVDFYYPKCDSIDIAKVKHEFRMLFEESFLRQNCFPSTICDTSEEVSVECTALSNPMTIDGVEYNGNVQINFDIYGTIKNPIKDENVHGLKLEETKAVLDNRAMDFEEQVNLGQFDIQVAEDTLLIVKSDSYIGFTINAFCDKGSFLKDNKCVICPVGTFQSNQDEYCEPCPVGTYQDEDGQIECKGCPDGHTTSGRQTASLGECITA